MKRILAFSFFVLVLFFTWIYLSKEETNCSTFRISVNNELYGCNFVMDFGDGLTTKVVNLKRYVFLFNRYLILDLVQVKNGKNFHEFRLAKVYGFDGSISVIIRSTQDISTEPDEKRISLSIVDFKKWLDINNFSGKQVVATLFKDKGELWQYFVGISVYSGDVKSN